MNFKIQNTTLMTCDTNGFSLRRIAENVFNAYFNEKTKEFVITLDTGRVELRDTNGFQTRVICEGASDARYQGSEIVVRLKNGVNQLRNRDGFVIRNL
jgi:hypothetical protein